jgi:hypothetical protein
MSIHKSFSKQELISLINTIKLPIVFSVVDNKSDIIEKLIDYLGDGKEKVFHQNYYSVRCKRDLINYLKNTNPRKKLNTKQRGDIMNICKYIIEFYKNNQEFERSLKYNNFQEILDDVLYIRQFGDLSSVRRTIKIYNDYQIPIERQECIISPDIQKKLDERVIIKNYRQILTIRPGPHIISFN